MCSVMCNLQAQQYTEASNIMHPTIFPGQFALHVHARYYNTIFTQDHQGYYVQDFISDQFDEEEKVTAFCEG